jgi:hypothetical protein
MNYYIANVKFLYLSSNFVKEKYKSSDDCDELFAPNVICSSHNLYDDIPT